MNEDVALFFPTPNSRSFPGLQDDAYRKMPFESKKKLCEQFVENYHIMSNQNQELAPSDVFGKVYDLYEVQARGIAIKNLSILALKQVICHRNWYNCIQRVH